MLPFAFTIRRAGKMAIRMKSKSRDVSFKCVLQDTDLLHGEQVVTVYLTRSYVDLEEIEGQIPK